MRPDNSARAAALDELPETWSALQVTALDVERSTCLVCANHIAPAYLAA